MTGRELCDILDIDYGALREARKNEQPENLQYFVQELLNIPDVRQMILQMLSDDHAEVNKGGGHE